MTLSDELKILDDKIKQIKLSMIQVKKQPKYLLYLLKIFCKNTNIDWLKDLGHKDLGHRPSVLEKTKFEYSPLGMSLTKSFKKDNVKNIANRESDFNYDSKHSFYRFYKEYNELEEMSLDSKWNKMKEVY